MFSPQTAERYRQHVEALAEPEHGPDEASIFLAAHALLETLTPGEEKAIRLSFGMKDNSALEDVRLGSWRAAMRKLRKLARGRQNVSFVTPTNVQFTGLQTL